MTMGTRTAGGHADSYTTHADARVADSPLGRYARWQARDFVRQRAGVLLLIAGIMIYPLLIDSWMGRPIDEEIREQLRKAIIFFMAAGVTVIGTLIGTRGIVSEDRAQGYHRFLFAKPVDAVRYYAQAFGIELAGILAVLAVVGGLYALLVASFPPLAIFLPAVAFFVLFGGITFFFSTITRREWIWTLGLVALTAAVQAFATLPFAYGFLEPLLLVLPPLEAFGNMLEAFMRGQTSRALAWGAWPLLYGAGAFVAGLQVLKRRAMSR